MRAYTVWHWFLVGCLFLVTGGQIGWQHFVFFGCLYLAVIVLWWAAWASWKVLCFLGSHWTRTKPPRESRSMKKQIYEFACFSFWYWLVAGVLIALASGPPVGSNPEAAKSIFYVFLFPYLVPSVPFCCYLLWHLLCCLWRVGSPLLQPSPLKVRMKAAKAKYRETLKNLKWADLDPMERNAARARAKTRYLKEIEEGMK